MSTERIEWVEIVEPSSRNIMYANLTSGQCVWEPPPNVSVKKFDDNQWWELFDTNTSRFYYYNATSQKTVWHKPQNCDIIPLAKLQQIKQNTEVSENADKASKETTGTQTPSKGNTQPRVASASSPVSCLSPDLKLNGSLSSSSIGRSYARGRCPSTTSKGVTASSLVTGQGCSSCSEDQLGSFQRIEPVPSWKMPRPSTSCSTTTQTSPAPSPRPGRRASHHNHRHHQNTGGSSSSGGHHHHHHRRGSSCSHRHQNLQEGSTATSGVLVDAESNTNPSRRIRRSSQSSQSSAVSYSSKPLIESGRISDSSMSQSRTSIESSKAPDCSFPVGSRDGHLSRGPNFDKIPQSQITSSSTPLCQRRLSHEPAHHGAMSKQRSFDVANYPKCSEFSVERPREMPLSRSYSFMSRPKYYDEDGAHERFLASGMCSVESTPQTHRRHKGLDAIASSPESSLASRGIHSYRQKSDSSGLDSLATPMTHRKQRSLETAAKGKPKDLILNPRKATSDSSNSPPSPRHDFLVSFSPRCPDSGASTLTDKDTRSQYGRGSADSSPHSQIDSGLVSGTTGSRGSADSGLMRTYDSRIASFGSDGQTYRVSGGVGSAISDKEPRRCGHHRKHHCSKHRLPTSTTPALNTTDSDRSDTLQSSSSSVHVIHSGNNSHNHNSSSASSTTAKQLSPKNRSKQSSPIDTTPLNVMKIPNSPAVCETEKPKINHHKDMTHLYSNIDYVYDQPVYQYIMEQAKLSGYRFGGSVFEDGDSLHSDDSGERIDDSDEFADDEGMSNADSSSQEYLDDVNYLADDETYTQFFMPSVTKNSSTVDGVKSGEIPVSNREIQPPISLMSSLRMGGKDLIISSPIPTELPASMAIQNQSYYSNVPSELQFGSLRRKKEPAPQPPPVCSPIQERTESVSTYSLMKKPHSETDIEHLASLEGFSSGPNMMEKYAQENLNVHTRGLLRKKVPVIDMISWTKEPIRKPMLATIDKSFKNQACELFKLVQIYMSDRKPKPEMTLNSVGLDIVTLAYNNPGLRDELFVQVCRQTTENHKRDSLRRGWELTAICLQFFPPSDKFCPYLAGYIAKHCDPAYHTMYPEISKWPIHIQINHYAGVCNKRLERTTINEKRHRLKKPTLEEIDLARLHIFRASMFGGTMEEVMALQRERYPHRRLPWVQTTLSEEVLRLQGTNTEGIFRVPADFDEVNQLKQVIDQWEVGDCGDPHVMAALLKLWYRELYHPLIPDNLYASAIEAHEHPVKAVALVNQLPEINRLILAYLIRFLQYFSQPQIVIATKMDASNLAMVMAPNCLRCTSEDPKIIYENTRKEMAFMRVLIQHLDTTFMEGMV